MTLNFPNYFTLCCVRRFVTSVCEIRYINKLVHTTK